MNIYISLSPSAKWKKRPVIHTYLSQSFQCVCQHGICKVSLCELCDELLKLVFKQLRVWKQSLLVVRPIANSVSLQRRDAQQVRGVSWPEGGHGQPNGPDNFMGTGDPAQQASHYPSTVQLCRPVTNVSIGKGKSHGCSRWGSTRWL